MTVDFDTLEDNKVTIRDRDTMEQIRISIDEVERYIKEKKKKKKYNDYIKIDILKLFKFIIFKIPSYNKIYGGILLCVEL